MAAESAGINVFSTHLSSGAGSSNDSSTTRKDWENEYIKKTPLFQIDPNMVSGGGVIK